MLLSFRILRHELETTRVSTVLSPRIKEFEAVAILQGEAGEKEDWPHTLQDMDILAARNSFEFKMRCFEGHRYGKSPRRNANGHCM